MRAGADFVFPYGHKSTVYLNLNYWSEFMTVVLKGVAKYNQPHIILTGSQGKFLPRSKSFQELTHITNLNSLHYFCGVQPDGIVCVINPEDTVEQIRHIVQVTQIFSNGKIIFYAMSPRMRQFTQTANGKTIAMHRVLQPDEMQEKMSFFASELGAPVIDVMDVQNEKWILETIEQNFS